MMTSFFSPYMVLFLLLALLIYPYQVSQGKLRKFVVACCFVMFVVFFGLHGNVGDDYDAYMHYYNMPWTSKDRLLTFEPGFYLFTSFFKAIGLSFTVFLFVYACIVNTLLMRFCIQVKGNIPLMLCIFVATGGVASEINFLRSMVALMLFVNSLTYLCNRKPFPFFLMNIIGVFFHFSSLLYLPCYFILHKRLSPTALWMILAVAAILSPFHIQFLGFVPLLADVLDFGFLQHFAQYVIAPGPQPLGFTTGLIERLLTAFAVCYYYDKLTKTPLLRVAVNAFLFYFLFYSLLSGYPTLATRLGNMFVFAYWLLWPAILKLANGWSRYTIAFLMFVYLALRVGSMAIHPQWHYVFFS
jgi:hypothetical protein